MFVLDVWGMSAKLESVSKSMLRAIFGERLLLEREREQ